MPDPWSYAAPPGWTTTRRRVLARDARTCYVCGNDATEVDHVTSVAEWLAHGLPGDPHDESNLAAICHDDHETKTKRERRDGMARGRARQPGSLPPERHPGAIG